MDDAKLKELATRYAAERKRYSEFFFYTAEMLVDLYRRYARDGAWAKAAEFSGKWVGGAASQSDAQQTAKNFTLFVEQNA